MRDPERIKEIMKQLEILWNKYPDMRFGQIVENFCVQGNVTRMFYQEDEITLEKLERANELY